MSSIWERMAAAGIDIQKVESESPEHPDTYIYTLPAGRVAFGPAAGDEAKGWDIAAYDADGEHISQNWVPDEAAALKVAADLASTILA